MDRGGGRWIWNTQHLRTLSMCRGTLDPPPSDRGFSGLNTKASSEPAEGGGKGRVRLKSGTKASSAAPIQLALRYFQRPDAHPRVAVGLQRWSRGETLME